jgi:uncharacterized protein (DUF1330 family)
MRGLRALATVAARQLGCRAGGMGAGDDVAAKEADRGVRRSRFMKVPRSSSDHGGTVTAYVIYQGEVLDPERYDEYKIKAAASILAAGGRYVVRGGDVEVLEGDAPAGRTVVLEFPSRQAAIDWYRSEEYTEIRKIREGAARARMYVVDGVT